MPINRIPGAPEPEDPEAHFWTHRQMAEVLGERDQYRQALYDATNARLVGSDKVAAALNVVDTLHRELHTVTGERDTARRQLEDADQILDSPLRTIGFAFGVITQAAKERRSHRRSTRKLRAKRTVPRRERRPPRWGS